MPLNEKQQQLIRRIAPASRWLLALLLVVWLAKVLADTVLLWISGPQDPVPPRADLPRITISDNGRQTSQLSTRQVSEWKLFGDYQAEPQRIEPVDAPDTRLRLELVGLFQHADGTLARAIIAEQGGDADLYRPGDSVPGNAVLEDIYADRVILRRQGQLETLRLRETELRGEISSGSDSRPRAASRSTPQRPPRGNAQGSREDTPQEPDLAQLEGDPMAQRDAIIQQLSLDAVQEGAASGYRITDNAPREMIGSVGLRPGDVILSVNGHALGEESGDLAAIREVMNAGAATIEVERGSRRFTVSYPP